MKNITVSSRSLRILALAGMLSLPACADLNNYPSRGGYNDPYYGGHDSYYDHHDYDKHERWEEKRDRERDREEARERDRERERAEEARREHEAEERRRREEHCPSGFSPSERKCSNDERRHGCQDIRLPSGLGCVRR